MNIVFTGGGTAGHVSPCIAVAKEMKLQYPNTRILFIARKGGCENELIQKAGFSYKEIDIQGYQRKLSSQLIKTIWKAERAVKESKDILKDFSANAVFATGGYVSFPVVKAAHKLHIPTVLHEANATPGLANRLLFRRANSILWNVAPMRPLSTKEHVVGMPIDPVFSHMTRNRARNMLGLLPTDFLLISFGGSLGAQVLNETCISVMEHFSAVHDNVFHIHATGQRYYDCKYCQDKFNFRQKRLQILPFIHNMPVLLNAADAVICRAGAATITEICAAGAPAILIPSPNVTDNHQYKNAKRLYDSGGCILLKEEEVTEDTVKEAVEDLYTSKTKRKELSKQASSFYEPNTEKRICRFILEISLYNSEQKALR